VIKKPRHEEAKARYWAVKIQPQWVVTPGKQTNNIWLINSAFVGQKNFEERMFILSLCINKKKNKV
jgi:hypothetical protein